MIFYNDISNQFNRKAPNDLGYKLLSPSGTLLPFIIARPKTGVAIQAVNVINYNTGSATPITLPHDVLTSTTEIVDYIVYYGGSIGVTLADGEYYLNVDGFVSEVFAVESDISCYIKLEWRNEGDICSKIYQTGFSNTIYLDADIARPDPIFEEEGSNNEDGVFIPEFQRSYKNHNISDLLIPEYLFDELRKVKQHSDIKVNGQKVDGFEFVGEWRDLLFFDATITFRTDECVTRACPENKTYTIL